MTLRGAIRRENSETHPSQSDFTGSTLFNPYDSARCTTTTCLIFGNLPTVTFGNLRYAAASRPGVHGVQRQRQPALWQSRSEVRHELPAHQGRRRRPAAAAEPAVCQHRRFRALRRRHRRPVSARRRRRAHAREDEIHLSNNYTAFFAQDDWRLGDKLTVNLGLRWEYDSEFEAKENFAPRVGVSWSVTPKTVVRGNFGIYYDQFRLGLARNVPALWRHRSADRAIPGVPATVLRLAVVRLEHRAAERPAGRLLLQQPGRQPHRRADHGGQCSLPGRRGRALHRRRSPQQRGGARPRADSGQHGGQRRQRPDPDGPQRAAVCGPGERRDWTAARVFRLRPDRLSHQRHHPGAAAAHRHRRQLRHAAHARLQPRRAARADHRHGDRGRLLSPRHPQPARRQERQHRVRIARARPPVPAALYAGTDSHVRTVLRRAVRRAGHQLQQALQPPLPGGRELHLRASDRQFARHQFSAVGQLHRHGARRHRDGDRPLECEWRVHARQRHAGAGGRARS